MSRPPYNPLDKLNLGKSVAEALLDQDSFPLSALPSIAGAGIYVLYYNGLHPAYVKLAEANASAATMPIYVGKAVPSGGRKGALTVAEAKGTFLLKRLQEHAESVEQALNLDIIDFQVRWLVVDDIWIPLGETLIITHFRPVWNSLLEGFGNHDPGGGRYNSLRPLWDVLHPGRKWADKCRQRSENAAELEAKVIDFLATMPIKQGRINFDPSSV